LKSICRELEANLIILGSHSASMLKRIFRTGTAAEVLASSTCPVLIIPEEATADFQIKKIAYPTNFRKRDRKVLKRILQFARLLDAEVCCVNVDLDHVAEYSRLAEKFVHKFGKYDRVQFHVVNALGFFGGITEFLDKEEIDMVAIGTHKRSFVEELFNFSKAKALTYHYKIPILAIHRETMKQLRRDLKRAKKHMKLISAI
jgi:nucleotide-binding universal stress UspA family protein